MGASPGPHSFVLALGLPRFDVCMGQNTRELLTLKTLAEGSPSFPLHPPLFLLTKHYLLFTNSNVTMKLNVFNHSSNSPSTQNRTVCSSWSILSRYYGGRSTGRTRYFALLAVLYSILAVVRSVCYISVRGVIKVITPILNSYVAQLFKYLLPSGQGVTCSLILF